MLVFPKRYLNPFHAFPFNPGEDTSIKSTYKKFFFWLLLVFILNSFTVVPPLLFFLDLKQQCYLPYTPHARSITSPASNPN